MISLDPITWSDLADSYSTYSQQTNDIESTEEPKENAPEARAK